MIILIHVIVALLSIAMATFVAFRPTNRRLIGHYVLVGSTIGTGAYLVIRDNAQLITACRAGLVYVGVAAVLTVIATIRLQTLNHTSTQL